MRIRKNHLTGGWNVGTKKFDPRFCFWNVRTFTEALALARDVIRKEEWKLANGWKY